jgi:peptidoglycan/LPS O-acetylase OafA/YrhL
MLNDSAVTTIPAPNPLSDALSRKQIPSLDGLRAVAVLLVIFHHLGIRFAPHGRGVLTFFVLSGFLITWLLLKESDRNESISVHNFYVRRILRIFPAFYVFWTLHVLVSLLARGKLSASAIADYVSAFFYVSNYWHAISRSMYHYIGHTWALSIEEQFYLIWPWIFVAFHKDLRKFTRVLVAIIFLVDVYRLVLFFGFHASDDWLTFTFDSRVDHLLVGCLLAVLLNRGVLTRFWNFLISRLWISAVTFGLITGSIALAFHYGPTYKYAAGFVLDPLLTAVFLVQVMALGNTWLWGWLNWRITRYCGRISYGMFLYHVFANELVRHFLVHRSIFLVAPAAVALAVLMGTCSYYLIEIRFLRAKSRFSGRPTPISVDAAVAVAAPTYQLTGS